MKSEAIGAPSCIRSQRPDYAIVCPIDPLAGILLQQQARRCHDAVDALVVNVLSPGQIATPIQEQMFDAETMRQFESLIPRGKMGRPEEIATVALFLASDDSSYVNGVELSVDGGTSAI